MVKRLGGMRRKSRYKLRKDIREKGKLSLRKYLQKFKLNDKVALIMEPRVHKGTFHLRFYGRTGIVTGQNGSCYTVKIMDGGKEKSLIVHPVHLRRV